MGKYVRVVIQDRKIHTILYLGVQMSQAHLEKKTQTCFLIYLSLCHCLVQLDVLGNKTQDIVEKPQ